MVVGSGFAKKMLQIKAIAVNCFDPKFNTNVILSSQQSNVIGFNVIYFDQKRAINSQYWLVI